MTFITHPRCGLTGPTIQFCSPRKPRTPTAGPSPKTPIIHYDRQVVTLVGGGPYCLGTLVGTVPFLSLGHPICVELSMLQTRSVLDLPYLVPKMSFFPAAILESL